MESNTKAMDCARLLHPSFWRVGVQSNPQHLGRPYLGAGVLSKISRAFNRAAPFLIPETLLLCVPEFCLSSCPIHGDLKAFHLTFTMQDDPERMYFRVNSHITCSL